MAVWASGCLSAARSSSDIMAAFGPRRMMGRAPRFPFLSLAVQKASRARLRHEELGALSTSASNHRTADSACMLLLYSGLKIATVSWSYFSLFWPNEGVDA